MKTLAPNELRMVNKILQVMKADHGVSISPKAEKLPELLAANLAVLDDPVVNAIWAPISTQILEQDSKTKATVGSPVSTEPATGNNKKGRYITYRGKKTWVEE